MFDFAYPWALALLVLPVAVWYYLLYWKKPPTVGRPSAAPFKDASGRRRRRLRWPDCCYLAAALLLTLSLARPRLGDEKVLIRAKGVDIILALDVSGSMEEIDLPRKVASTSELRAMLERGELASRLAAAKKEIIKFIEARPNDRIGLIAFGEMAYNVAPPTLDHAWLIEQVKRLEPMELISRRTGLAAPIASAAHRLKKSDAPRRVMVLFTDGENNVEDRISPQQAAELAKESDVIVHTVGIGSDRVLRETSFGWQVGEGGGFGEAMLREIAARADGTYFHAADGDGMAEVMRQINDLEKTVVEQPKYVEFREYAPSLAAVSLALLLLGLILENTVALRLP